MDPITLLELPLETIAVLGAGYLGYRLAYTGRDEAHRGVDVVFITLVFGLVAKAVMTSIAGLGWSGWLGILVGMALALAVAAGWRKWGQEGTFRLLRRANVSMADGHPTALQSVVMNERIRVSQVFVRRADGVVFMCDNPAAFNDTVTGPYFLGPDGSVALYATHRKGPGDKQWKDLTGQVRDPDCGDLITCIPADQVAMVELRVS